MINDTFTIDFRFCNTKNAYSTFFDWYRITVPQKTRQAWVNYEGIGKYKVFVDINSIKNLHSDIDTDSLSILEDISKFDNSIEIQANEGTWAGTVQNGQLIARYSNYIAIFSEYLWNKLSVLFISTFVTQNPESKVSTFVTQNPESKEGLKLTFNVQNKTVSIDDIYIDSHIDNPFYLFARRTAMLTTFKSVIKKEPTEKNKINYYEGEKASEWKKSEELERMKKEKIEIKNVVYMLFDCKNNYFYVGKANNMVQRLLKHRDDSNDEMCEFTHFRYTPIADAHINDIYLIENSAIHDCAAIFNMPSGNHYKYIDMETNIPGNINSKIIMTNDVEKQTK